MQEHLQKMMKDRGEKNLIVALNQLTQVKVNCYLNINLNLALKASVIKVGSMMRA